MLASWCLVVEMSPVNCSHPVSVDRQFSQPRAQLSVMYNVIASVSEPAPYIYLLR